MENSKVREACKTIYLKEYSCLLEELLEVFAMYRDLIVKDENLPKYVRTLVQKKQKPTYCEFFRSLLINFYDQPTMQKYIINYKKAKSFMSEIGDQVKQELDLNKTESP